jgi:ATP synthase protein I
MSDPGKGDTAHEQITQAVGEGWVAGGSFLSSILAGWLLGWLLDSWLGTDPWFIVIGIILGSINGFYRMWIFATKDGDVRTK